MDRLPVPSSHSLTVLGRGVEARGEKWLQLTDNPYENRVLLIMLSMLLSVWDGWCGRD